MLARFPALDNKPMGDDELCDILYQMVKHEWHKALRKSGRSSSEMSVTDLMDYFEQIELLDGFERKKSKTITVDDDRLVPRELVAIRVLRVTFGPIFDVYHFVNQLQLLRLKLEKYKYKLALQETPLKCNFIFIFL